MRVDREGPRERTVVGVSDPGSALGPVLQPPLSRTLRPSATFASFDAGAGGSAMFRDPLGAPLAYSPWGRVRSPYIQPGYVYGTGGWVFRLHIWAAFSASIFSSLRCVAWRCVALHCVALSCLALCYVAWRGVASRRVPFHLLIATRASCRRLVASSSSTPLLDPFFFGTGQWGPHSYPSSSFSPGLGALGHAGAAFFHLPRVYTAGGRRTRRRLEGNGEEEEGESESEGERGGERQGQEEQETPPPQLSTPPPFPNATAGERERLGGERALLASCPRTSNCFPCARCVGGDGDCKGRPGCQCYLVGQVDSSGNRIRATSGQSGRCNRWE